jgi:hypothetical protein
MIAANFPKRFDNLGAYRAFWASQFNPLLQHQHPEPIVDSEP